MKVFKHILIIFLGLSYLFSGYVKLFPIEFLENDILKSGLGGEMSVLFQSRLIVGSEFVIGALLVAHLFLKPVLKISLVMLAVYTAYLAYVIIRFGNEGNCGCYGHDVVMTPAEGILKNILIAVVTIFLLRTTLQPTIKRWQRFAAWAIVMIGMVLPFVLYKIDMPETTVINGEELRDPNRALVFKHTM